MAWTAVCARACCGRFRGLFFLAGIGRQPETTANGPCSNGDRYSNVLVRPSRSKHGRRIGVYGWGIVAPGAKNITALDALLREEKTALRTACRPELGEGLFAVGEPDFSIDDYVGWIAERKGEAFA